MAAYRPVCALAGALLGIALSSAPVTADVLYNTFGPGDSFDSGTVMIIGGPYPFNQVVAASFLTSVTANVTDAVLALQHQNGANFPVDLYILSDASGSPGSTVMSLHQLGVIDDIPGLVTFACYSDCQLTAGTYWLVGRDISDNTQQAWSHVPEGGPATIIAYNQVGSLTGPWVTAELPELAFRINGEPSVPEPASLLLLGPAVAGLLLMARRRRRAA